MTTKPKKSVSPPEGFVTLHQAMAIAGPRVVAAWSGEELTSSIWEPDPDVPQELAGFRWQELASWFCNEIEPIVFPLFQLNEDGTTSIVPKVLGNASPLFLAGCLTKLSFTETLEKLATNTPVCDGPRLLVQEVALQAAINNFLRPDDAPHWSFAGTIAWILWQRYDKVRDHQDYPAEFIRNEVADKYRDGAGITQTYKEAVSDLWRRLERGEILGWGLKAEARNVPRQIIPNHEWRDYELTQEEGEDVLSFRQKARGGTVAYHSPSLCREDVTTLWHAVLSADRQLKSTVLSKKEHSRKRGRPATYDWREFDLVADKKMKDHNGYTRTFTQAHLCRIMQKWWGDKRERETGWPSCPSQGSILDRLRQREQLFLQQIQ